MSFSCFDHDHVTLTPIQSGLHPTIIVHQLFGSFYKLEPCSSYNPILARKCFDAADEEAPSPLTSLTYMTLQTFLWKYNLVCAALMILRMAFAFTSLCSLFVIKKIKSLHAQISEVIIIILIVQQQLPWSCELAYYLFPVSHL